MPRINQIIASTGKRILIIDDEPDYLTTTTALLESEGHSVISATNGLDGLKLLRSEYFDLLLLDYYMPGSITGEDVVREIRKFNPYVQIVLQTGYSGEYPPREMLKRLDIQGYHDKSEGPQKLLMWVDVGLKMAYTVQLLNKSREGLKYILNVTPDLHKIQPLEDLLQGILIQISGLLGVVNSFLAILPLDKMEKTESKESGAFVAIVEDEEKLIIRAATGHYIDQQQINEYIDASVSKTDIMQIHDSIRSKQIKILVGSTVVPLLIGDQVLGVVYMDMGISKQQDIDLVKVFANQAAVAIQNSRLYEMATLDPLTGVYVRRIFDQWLLRELRIALRSKQELSLQVVDMDGLKKINDGIGHLAGDQALALLGKVLRQATRTTDFVCRYGGDEFVIILPKSQTEGSKIVGTRIIEALKEMQVPVANGEISISASIGGVTLEVSQTPSRDFPQPIPSSYFEAMLKHMIQEADKALYAVKHQGGNSINIDNIINWIPVD